MLEGEVYQEEEEEVYDMSDFENPHNDDDDDEDDEDETLSFCDLPIYYSRDDAQKESTNHAFSRSINQSSSSSSSTINENDDACFDFSFSSSSSQGLEEKNIIFCGKIIRPRTTEKMTCHARKSNSAAKYNNKTSKWYFLMLGLVKIHQGGNMELKDIKKRQTKRNHLKIVDNEMKVAGNNNNNNKVGLLSLLRSFSCTRSPTDDVDVEYCNKVKASLWYLQQLRPPHN